MMQDKYLLEKTGLLLLGIYCLLSAIFLSEFAKIHISCHFLNFPIFISAIILLICALIALILICQGRIILTQWHRLFFGYIAVILLWVGFDYFRLHHQALALRNGMLFIYPVCAFFSCSFYRPFFFNKRIALSLAVLLFLIAPVNCNGISSFACFLLFLIIVSSLLQGRWRWVIIIGTLLFWPYGAFLAGARTWLVGSAVAAIFLIVNLVKYFLPISQKWKTISIFIFTTVFLLGAFHFADKGGLITLFSPGHIMKRYEETERTIQAKSRGFHAQELSAQLYNPQGAHEITVSGMVKDYKLAVEPEIRPVPEKTVLIKSGNQEIAISEPATSRNIKDAYTDIIFRILVWKDMMQELVHKKAFLGVGMGWPQRSRSLEILDWAESEWSRDGWIAPHNSYLHLIYRAGVIGVGIVGVILFIFFNMVKLFIKGHSWKGLLLCGILLYGLVAANFLLIFELPYYAIPFWSIWGIALWHAYGKDTLTGKGFNAYIDRT